MRPIRKEDINKLNDVVMELPAFRDLESKDNMHDILDMFMEDIYRKKPQEVLDVFNFELNDRMQETFFINYGIDKSYYEKIRGYLKPDIAFSLEKLFQRKGSIQLFEMYAGLFENIFRRINIYNVRVHKTPTPMSEFKFEYKLEPLYVSDPSSVITTPQVPISKKRKYIMELADFTDYTAWPVPTNLVYIQFSVGTELINNMQVFLNGIRAYSTTLLQNEFFNYESASGEVEKIEGCSLELLLMYFKLETVSGRTPGWDFDETALQGTYLPWYEGSNSGYQDKEEFLQGIYQLMDDYKNANPVNRKEMQDLRRRWQFFLRAQETNTAQFTNMEELRDFIKARWPHVFKDFNTYLYDSEDPGLVLDFYVKLYSVFTNGIYTLEAGDDPTLVPAHQWDWVTAHIDVVFGNLFLTANFIENYFDPVMNLFIRYFFPVEMEYINDLINKVKIRDKWNAWATEEDTKTTVIARQTSIQTPIRGLDWRRISITLKNWHSHIDHTDKHSTTTYIPKTDGPLSPQDEVTSLNVNCSRWDTATNRGDYFIINDL